MATTRPLLRFTQAVCRSCKTAPRSGLLRHAPGTHYAGTATLRKLSTIPATRSSAPSTPPHDDVAPSAAAPGMDEAEAAVFAKLQAALSPTSLEVKDISGGCGSMYGIKVVSERFRDLSVVKQHKLVNEVLKEDISKWHGMQLVTRTP